MGSVFAGKVAVITGAASGIGRALAEELGRRAARGSGHIVNISSLAAIAGAPTMVPYGTTKAAVVGLSLSLRVEGEALGVKVTVVCPGYVQSGIYDASTYLRTRKEDLAAKIPFKLMDTDAAARTILRGVERNRPLIIFPFYARVLWWLTRLSYRLVLPIGRRYVSELRAARVET